MLLYVTRISATIQPSSTTKIGDRRWLKRHRLPSNGRTDGEGVAEDCRIVVQIVLTYNSRLLTKF